MAGASDKARFYLEKSIPDLHELERKKIFSKDEIIKIASRRSEFEHKLNVRGSTPEDYLRYVEYEKNLDELRRKRAKRLGARGKGHVGSMRIFSIYNRATKKFPGMLSLWTDYLDYARKQHAYKTVVEILTKVVRLHPSRPDVWIFAATLGFTENGDMTEARSYMQRGLRFCKDSKELWLAYGQLELTYLSKLARRQQILGLDKAEKVEQPTDQGPETDIIALPSITAAELDPSRAQEIEPGSAEDNLKTPALQGAIPMAIFDAAMERFENIELAGQFFDSTSELVNTPAAGRIASHITLKMRELAPNNARMLDCYVREPLVGMELASPEFPDRIRESIERLKSATRDSPSVELSARTVAWTTTYLSRDLDADLRAVVSRIAVGALTHYQSIHDNEGSGSSSEFTNLLQKLRSAKIKDELQPVVSWATLTWPDDKSLQEVGRAESRRAGA